MRVGAHKHKHLTFYFCKHTKSNIRKHNMHAFTISLLMFTGALKIGHVLPFQMGAICLHYDFRIKVDYHKGSWTGDTEF